MTMSNMKKHFVLVHGAWHGGWCWYKLLPLLKSEGHLVTAVDLGASGVNPKQLNDLLSFSDYIQPLMDLLASLPPYERVVLVGHSYGGLSISLATEKYAGKIAAAVFVSAYMPNFVDPPATQVQQYFKTLSAETFLDVKIEFDQESHQPLSTTFGPNYLEKIMYHHCKQKDVELAKTLVRPSGFFLKDLEKEWLLTEAKYGSVNRVFVVCEEDEVVKEEFQRWVIDVSPPKQVMVISEAGHMVMLTKPKQLSQSLLQIAHIYH